MNKPESDNTFVPKRAILPTPQLYAELAGDTFQRLATISLAEIPPIPAGSVLHDNGCGTGVATAAIVESISESKVDVSIKATDINDAALAIYKAKAAAGSWPTEAAHMDAMKLEFPDETFTHSIGNALLFVLPGDGGADAVREAYRTLKPGGTLIVNSWNHIPNMEPLQVANRLTRPEGTPFIREDMKRWADPEFLRGTVERGGFAKDKIRIVQPEVYCYTPELTRFANMLWSFVGGTNAIGWLESDEENWDKAIEIITDELRKTDGFEEVEGGKAKLKFIANIVIATKEA